MAILSKYYNSELLELKIIDVRERQCVFTNYSRKTWHWGETECWANRRANNEKNDMFLMLSTGDNKNEF